MMKLTSFITLALASGIASSAEIDFKSLEQSNPGTSVSVEADSNKRLESFRNTAKWRLRNSDDKVEIISCSKLLTINLVNARGNTSYGGLCEANYSGKHKSVLICDDEMVGHFKIQVIDTQDYGSLKLAEFIYSNCYGG